MFSQSIALFGGSFDPVHNGHLASIKKVQAKFKFKQFYIIPGRLPPHKAVAPAYHRVKMLRLALRDIEQPRNVRVSDVEIRSKRVSYSYWTIRHFQKRHPKVPLVFIIGQDAFADIESWYRFPSVLKASSYIILTRQGADHGPLKDTIKRLLRKHLIRPRNMGEYEILGGNKLYFIKIALPKISSTEVRKKMKNGNPLSGRVPRSVEAYLKRFCLYDT